MSDSYVDQAWHGPEASVSAALMALGWPEALAAPVLVVVAPRVLDGVSYVLIRSSAPLALPDGLAVTGPDLSLALVGGIA
jgi:hypothetical protein